MQNSRSAYLADCARGGNESYAVAEMYRQRAPTPWLAVLLALAGGALLSREHWIAGAILVVLALVLPPSISPDHQDLVD
jgi:hypothetical protein